MSESAGDEDSIAEIDPGRDEGGVATPQPPADAEEPDSDPEGEGTRLLSDRVYICRAAVFLLRMPEGTESLFTGPEATALSQGVESKLREALIGDSRITEVIDPPEFNVQNACTVTAWERGQDPEDPVRAVHSFQALRLNSDFTFRVRVPAKNQPQYRGRDDVPTDDYLVVWDGVSLFVQWAQDSPRVHGSGGHVVFDVLHDVTQAAGYDAVHCACTTNCHHRFIHADLVTFDSEAPPDHFCKSGSTPVGLSVITPYSVQPSDVENIRMTSRRLVSLVGQYAEARTRADAVRMMANAAMDSTAEMSGITYDRVARRRLPSPGGLRDLWELRGSRKRIREIIASLWLALTFLTTRQVQWRRWRSRLMDDLSNPRFEDLTSVFDADSDLADGVDLDIIRASVEHTSTTLESRALILATASGAMAVLFGVILAHFLG